MGLGNLLKNNPPEVVMGIDASTKAYAFTVIKNGKVICKKKILFNGSTLNERLRSAAIAVEEMVVKSPDKAYIESAVYINNRQVVIQLAYFYGVLMGGLARHGIDVELVAPISWMTHIGNPNFTKSEKEAFKEEYADLSKSGLKNKMRDARKNKTIRLVNEKYKLRVTDNDIADSAGIAWFGYDKEAS